MYIEISHGSFLLCYILNTLSLQSRVAERGNTLFTHSKIRIESANCYGKLVQQLVSIRIFNIKPSFDLLHLLHLRYQFKYALICL